MCKILRIGFTFIPLNPLQPTVVVVDMSEYAGLGKLNDRQLAARITWTKEENDAFMDLIKVHKHNLKYIARILNKSLLEIQARVDYLDELSRKCGSGGESDRVNLPIALEVDESLDKVHGLSSTRRIYFDPINTDLTCDQATLLGSKSARHVFARKHTKALVLDMRGITGVHNTRSIEIIRLTKLFLIKLVTKLAQDTIRGGKLHITLERVRKELARLPNQRVLTAPQPGGEDEIEVEEDSTDGEIDDASSMDSEELNEVEWIQIKQQLPGTEISLDADDHSYETDQILDEMSEEEHINQLDISKSQRFASNLSEEIGRRVKPRHVPEDKLKLIRQNPPQFHLKSQRVCWCCGIQNENGKYLNGAHPDLKIMCDKCFAWISRWDKLPPTDEILERRHKLDSKPDLGSLKDYCHICGDEDQQEYHTGHEPFRSVCRKCAVWIVARQRKGELLVSDIQLHLQHETDIDTAQNKQVYPPFYEAELVPDIYGKIPGSSTGIRPKK